MLIHRCITTSFKVFTALYPASRILTLFNIWCCSLSRWHGHNLISCLLIERWNCSWFSPLLVIRVTCSNLESKSIQQSTQLASLIGHTTTFWISTWVGLIILCKRFFTFFSRFLKKIEKVAFLTFFEFAMYVFHNPGDFDCIILIGQWWEKMMGVSTSYYVKLTALWGVDERKREKAERAA